jgi:pimeloyl-ACP methyl ester carboxylesterase
MSLEVVTGGPSEGIPVFLLHGTPGAAGLYPPMVDAAAACGVMLIAYSRPGYGDSERRPGRSVADCAQDVADVADQLGIDCFRVSGGSGGGPHALACAALLSDRVIAAASIAGGAPYDAAGLDWIAGMAKENVEEFGAAATGHDELLAFIEREAATMTGDSGDEVADELGDPVSEPDRELIVGPFGEHMGRQLKHALANGIWGWFDDDIAFVSGWGFDVKDISVPVSIWHGGLDKFVPFAHGEWLAANVPGAQAHLIADEAHVSLAVGRFGDVLDDLLRAG